MTRALAAMRAIALLLAMAATGAGAGSQPTEEGAGRPQPAPGTGVLCSWVFLTAAQEVGRQCFAGQDPAFQASLGSAVARLDAYIRSNAGVTEDVIATWRRDQALVGAPRERLCTGDPHKIYEAFREAGADKVKQIADELAARPGRPTVGDCV